MVLFFTLKSENIFVFPSATVLTNSYPNTILNVPEGSTWVCLNHSHCLVWPKLHCLVFQLLESVCLDNIVLQHYYPSLDLLHLS